VFQYELALEAFFFLLTPLSSSFLVSVLHVFSGPLLAFLWVMAKSEFFSVRGFRPKVPGLSADIFFAGGKTGDFSIGPTFRRQAWRFQAF
jgi:hypothetical protein